MTERFHPMGQDIINEVSLFLYGKLVTELNDLEYMAVEKKIEEQRIKEQECLTEWKNRKGGGYPIYCLITIIGIRGKMRNKAFDTKLPKFRIGDIVVSTQHFDHGQKTIDQIIQSEDGWKYHFAEPQTQPYHSEYYLRQVQTPAPLLS